MGAKVLLALFVVCASASIDADSHVMTGEAGFVGWLGETYYQKAAAPGAHAAAGDHSSAASTDKIEVVSWEPRVFLQSGFLSPEECDYLRAKAEPRLHPSAVTDFNRPGTPKTTINQGRTSTGTFFARQEDDVIAGIEQRIATWTMVAPENSEGMQVLRYQVGQRYDAHTDFFDASSATLNGGNRVATVIMYLTNVEQGGETVFPEVPKLEHQTAANGWTECGMLGLGVRPKKGDAVLFWSRKPDGAFDPLTLHTSCPVVKGTKMVATKWIHETEYDVTAVGDVSSTAHRAKHRRAAAQHSLLAALSAGLGSRTAH